VAKNLLINMIWKGELYKIMNSWQSLNLGLSNPLNSF
jgi:hypothetical protein